MPVSSPGPGGAALDPFSRAGEAVVSKRDRADAPSPNEARSGHDLAGPRGVWSALLLLAVFAASATAYALSGPAGAARSGWLLSAAPDALLDSLVGTSTLPAPHSPGLAGDAHAAETRGAARPPEAGTGGRAHDSAPAKSEVRAGATGGSWSSGGVQDEGPAASAPSKCSDACFERGTCSEERGECVCITQYTGPDCTEHAMPACHLAQDYWTPCTLPTTCECAVQCQQWRLPTPQYCLRGTYPDGTRITNLTEIFSGPQYALTWDSGKTEYLEPDYAAPVEEQSGVTTPEACPSMCSGHGVCSRQDNTCQCPWAALGEACEDGGGFHVPCFNGCSGKGHCLFGVCKCHRGYFGMDCSLFLAKDGKTRILSRQPYEWTNADWPPTKGELRPKVYVYDLPNHFHTWQGLHSNAYDWPEPVWFIERILNTPHRTADPEEADFFFFPLFIRNRDNNRANIIAWAREWVRKRFPFWDRHGGRDHFVLTNSDWGNCELWGPGGAGVLHPVLDAMFTVTLWGLTKSMHLAKRRPCFRPGRDIVIPPDMDVAVYRHAPGLGGNSSTADRSILLYFRGYSAEGERPWGRGRYTWSFGVRQLVFRHFRDRHNETGILLDTMSDEDPDRHLRFMLKSIFCLAPAGWGWGMRTTQAVIMGCIPVVIQPDVVQPFQGDGLEWSEFSVVLGKKDIPQLPHILRAVPQEKIRSMRKAMEQVKWRFIWSSPNHNPLLLLHQTEQDRLAKWLVTSDAFAGIMEALRLRLERAQNTSRDQPSPATA